ncbi:MAG: hypothetical protein ABIE07_09355 [Candidatus Zixiibacteriota bacterium]
MDVALGVNLVLGIFNILLLLYNVSEKRKQSQYQKKLALYEKRRDIFHAIMSYIATILRRPNQLTHEDSKELMRKTIDAEFLFDDDILEYRKEIFGKGLEIITHNEMLENLPVGDERNKIVNEQHENIKWCHAKFSETKQIFAEYLDLTKD